MPLWLVYHPQGTFTTAESKHALAADITSIYTGLGLPAFYVVVNFVPPAATDNFVGGTNSPASKPFIRFVVDHISIHVADSDDATHMSRMASKVDEVLGPHVADKGYDWEFHMDETPRGMWMINGFIPPPCG